MQFRRFTRNNFRRGRRSFSRFRPRATSNRAQAPRVWEVGQYFFETQEELDMGGELADLVIRYVRIASTRTIGDFSTGQGQALQSAARSIDVGGVVFDWGVYNDSGYDAAASPVEGRMYCMHALVADKIDGAGLPGSVATYNPFITSTPVSSVGVATPSGLAAEITRPNRILWQQTFELQYSPTQIIGPTAGELYVPDGQQVGTRRTTLNKRLRLRLDDDVGLFHVFAYKQSALFATSFVPFATEWVRGNIYYRFNF